MLLLAVLINLVWTSAVRAEEPRLPQIVTHSDTKFGVFRGDTLKLQVEARGKNLEVTWATRNQVVCRSATCEINTDSWSLGRHSVVLVVYNEQASLSLRYSIRIVEPKIGYKPGTVTPKQVAAGDEISTSRKDDLSVKVLSGRGFSYHRSKLEVVGELPRSLEWLETLKSQPGAALWFGKHGQEAHLLLSESRVSLARGQEDRRIIALRQGTLRSRQLNGEDPEWTVLVGDWLQVDGDAKADFIVSFEPSEDNEESSATVTVLRGAVRALQHPAVAKDQPKDAEDSTTDAAANPRITFIDQGMSQTFGKGEKTPSPSFIPMSKDLGKLVRTSTPFLARGHHGALPDGGALLRQIPSDFGTALSIAAEAAANMDYPVVIEVLNNYAGDSKKDYSANMFLGDAYRGLFLNQDAFHHYKAAAALKPTSGEPALALGSMYLVDRNWKKAVQWLEKALAKDLKDDTLAEYYLGVALHRLGESAAADSHFEYVLWGEPHPAVRESAAKFKGAEQDSSMFEIYGYLGLLYDNNVLHTSKSGLELLHQSEQGAPPPTITDGTTTTTINVPDPHSPINVNKSAGYLAAAGFKVYGLNQPSAKLSFGFDIARTGWQEKDLEALSLVDQSLSLGLAAAWVDQGPAYLELDLKSGLAMIYVGDQRAFDRVPSRITLSSPWLYGAYAEVASDLNLDPIPARDDVYDPILQEPVTAGERSNRYFGLSLGAKPKFADLALHVRGESSTLVFRSNRHQGENAKGQRLHLGLTYAATIRHHFGLGLEQMQRSFAGEEGQMQRKDQDTRIEARWTMRITAKLSSEFAVLNQTHGSNVERHKWGRQTANLGLGLSL